MDKFDRALAGFNEMDDLAARRSPVHALHPLAKLIATVAFVCVTVSFGRRDLFRASVMLLYPVLIFTLAGLSVRGCFYKLRVALPLVLAVGLADPFLDKTIALRIAGISVSGGVLSMLTLMLKGVLALMAAYAFAATTPMDALCAALRRVHVPAFLVTLLMLTYRYVSVMIEQLGVMMQAYRLRAPGHKGVAFSAWGSFLGQLLLRSMDRAQALYESMQLRGFDGAFEYVPESKFDIPSLMFTLASLAFVALARSVDIAVLLGSALVR